MKSLRFGVIPAAGRATRLAGLPLTKILPKPMLPILGKPILEYVVENMKLMGVYEIYVIIPQSEGPIQSYFDDGSDFNVHMRYVVQDKPLGIAEAIGLIEDRIFEPFVVILGDDFTLSQSLHKLAERFFARKALAVEAVVAETSKKTLSETCSVTMDPDGIVRNISEKPANPQSAVRGCGIYIFEPAVFGYISKTPITPERNQKEITTSLSIMAQSKRFYGVLIDGLNVNVNTYNDLVKCTRLLLGSSTNSVKSRHASNSHRTIRRVEA